MNHKQALQYFTDIQAIWHPFCNKDRIIPFCTPVFARPTALVIGTNHSNFAPENASSARAIADRYASQIPTDNTFLKHSHSFATGLRQACSDADITIDSTWMGTNRCAVQTDSSGLAALKRSKDFTPCQLAMDELLRRFVLDIQPINLILAGAHAVDLYYLNRRDRITDLDCLTLEPVCGKFVTNVIPIPHPSMNYHRAKITTKLHEYFLHPEKCL